MPMDLAMIYLFPAGIWLYICRAVYGRKKIKSATEEKLFAGNKRKNYDEGAGCQ